MTESKFTPDHAGVGDMLRSEFMQRTVLLVAERIRVHAESISPIGHKRDGHPGRYRASFHTRVHDRGGATHDRAEAIVWNDSPEAIYVEWAHYGEEPYHIMLRAAVGTKL